LLAREKAGFPDELFQNSLVAKEFWEPAGAVEGFFGRKIETLGKVLGDDAKRRVQ
jgi:hypothetical protein